MNDTGPRPAHWRRPRVPVRLRRGAALLPTMFTLGNLFFGFWAIVRTLNGEFADAAPLIGFAVVLDMLDGRIARLTGTASEFGAELDSLADVISFGVAPALLAYAWAFGSIPRPGWLAAFLFVMCGTLRLARFNVQRQVVDGRFFVGLPIPAGAAQVAAVVNFVQQPVIGRSLSIVAMAGLVVVAFLMVSTLRYRSFKSIDLKSRRSYIYILGMGLLFLLVALHPEWVWLCAACAYTLSGPIAYLVGLVRRRRSDVAQPPAQTVTEPGS